MNSRLRFSSLLSYCPRGRWPAEPTDAMRRSVEWMKAVKSGQRDQLGGRDPYETIVAHMVKHGACATRFGSAADRTVLVPIPSSSLPPPEEPYWWPARELAQALLRHGLGREVLPLLRRTLPVPKAALRGPRNAHAHRDSLDLLNAVLPSNHIVLVDDVITSGASMTGCALRLTAGFPGLESIAGFAAVRTVSAPGDFLAILAPTDGEITVYASGSCHREP